MCEDFPCCGHESGCCPDFDESGKQLNMRCTCGAKIPLSSRSSICRGCLEQARREDCDFEREDRDTFDDEELEADEDEFDGQLDSEDYVDTEPEEREYSPDDDGEALLGLGGE